MLFLDTKEKKIRTEINIQALGKGITSSVIGYARSRRKKHIATFVKLGLILNQEVNPTLKNIWHPKSILQLQKA